MLRRLLPLLILLALIAPVRAVDVSILDFQRKPNALKKLSKEESEFLAGKVRKVASQTDRTWRILSRETIQKILEENGKEYAECMASAEGKCEVAIGQILQADYHVVGDFSFVGGEIALSMRLYDVKTSSLKASEDVTGPTVKALMGTVDAGAKRLFASVTGGETGSGVAVVENPTGARASAVAEAAPDEVGTIVTISAEGGSADISVDGKKVCPDRESCQQELGNGKHVVLVSRAGYRDTTFSIAVPKGANRYTVGLRAQTGWLTLRAQDASGSAVVASIWVDGREVGQTPKSLSMALTAREVVLKADGYKDATVSERPDREGAKASALVTLEPKAPKAAAGMVSIPAGCFQMGSSSGDEDEKPVHQVCVRGFSMDATEVTNAAYERTGKQGHYEDGSCYAFKDGKWELGVVPDRFRGGTQPVVCVDWNEAKAYCESQGKRLPTEAEFEYATRAGTTTTYFWGDDADAGCRYANGTDQTLLSNGSSWNKKMECRDGYSDVTAPAGSFQANGWGLSDMTGNVWEWTSDWYDKDYYGSSSRQDPSGPASGSYRVDRGGSWKDVPAGLRSSNRDYGTPGLRGFILGFRCVASGP